MRYTIAGKNMDVTESLDAAIRGKLDKLDRYFAPETECRVTLSVEKDRQRIEVTVPVKGRIIRAEQESNDMYVSIDLVEEIIERQLRRYKNKIVDRHQDAGNAFKAEFVAREAPETDEIRISRRKQFDMKPMYPEDACLEMELLGHDFYLFCNAETEQICVVYKRKGGTYGLIEPDL